MGPRGQGSLWRTHGISVEGYRHRREGVPCQDAWAEAATGPEHARVVVLAVADGAGSRPRSDEGSQLAVHLATAYFAERVRTAHLFANSTGATAVDGRAAHELLGDTFLEVRDEFLRRTGENGGRPDDFATTLTVVVLAPTWIGYASVGDGFVILRAGSDGGTPLYHLLPQPEAVSEYSNETVFLTSRDAPRRFHTECVLDPEANGVLLSTDGLAQAAISWFGGRAIDPNKSFATAVFRSLDNPGPDPRADEDALATLLRSDRLTALNADDKTLLRAVRDVPVMRP
ncbi:PP2C family serine/threonine-protein phosphatase [Yinghuangia sp. YIM S09857]|uniref:PP2C family serine/threonine-protein phosphatase n=1 Tax=Yinghuangia sp. YIM S09857 TaxID=3436929 RepID=UPI003F52E599